MRESAQLNVSLREQRQYDAAAAQCVQKAVAAHTVHRPNMPGAGWSLVRRQHHLAVYKASGCHIPRDPNATVLCAIGRVPGTVAQVMDGLYSDTTESLQAVKTMAGHSLMDACVLHVSERRSDELPFRFAGIKWFATKAAWGLAGYRDVLSFERMGVTRDDDGNEFAYHVVSSIHRPEWPHNVMKGVHRQDIASCFLYRPLGSSGFVECFGFCEAFELGASRSAKMTEYMIAGSLLGVEHAASISLAKRFSRFLGIVQPGRWPPSYLCHVCYDRPFLTSHRQCAACLQSTCMSCLSRRQIFKLDPRTKRPMEQRFCRLCVEVVAAISTAEDDSVDLSSSRAVTNSQSCEEWEPSTSIVAASKEASLVGTVSATKWSSTVAAVTPVPQGSRKQIEPMRSQPEELSSRGRPPSTNCLADLATLTRSNCQPPRGSALQRAKHRRGGSCRFPSATSSAPPSASTTMSVVSTQHRDNSYAFFRPLNECRKSRGDFLQQNDLLLSGGSRSERFVSPANLQRGSNRSEQTFTIDTINNSSVSTSRISTTAFAPGLSQFELEVDLSAVLRAAGADLGDDDDSSASDADLQSLSPRTKLLLKSNQTSRTALKDGTGTDKSSFLADLYSLSLSMSPR